MLLKVPVFVSMDNRGIHEVSLPGISTNSFRGPSLAELLDDMALHLMETVPKERATELWRYELCPHMELRKVTIGLEGRDWSGRMPVVVTRWPEDGFFLARVPRMEAPPIALAGTGDLRQALTVALEHRSPEDLEPFCCRWTDSLEVLEVEVELPSILPSRPPRRRKKKKKKKKRRDGALAKKEPASPARRERLMVAPETLRQVGMDLTHRALDGRLSSAHGRDPLVELLLGLVQQDSAAVLLVGPTGVGKTALVHELVRRMAAVPARVQERQHVWEVDGNRLIAGMSGVGEWQQRCRQMIHELSTRQDLLYVPDLPVLVYAGRSRDSDDNVAAFLEPHLSRDELRVIGECTPERLELAREEAPGFVSRFRVVQVPEMSERQALMVLVRTMRRLEQDNLAVSPDCLDAVLALTRRFQARLCHPGKAVTLLNRLASDHDVPQHDELGRLLLTRETAIRFFSRQTGLPDFILWEEAARPHQEVQDHFSRRIVGQAAAVTAVTNVVTVLQQGLNDPGRPLATLLMVGPTGVGKTETAKALAEYLFGSADRLVRFDMSEFMTRASVARLIGDRFSPEGELTSKVQQQPFAVVLLDEIEKAHPAIFDALLQLLGEGRMTNAAGVTVDFCSTVVIMTSNLGAREAGRSLGFGPGDTRELERQYRAAAEAFFRPEFFNRIDRVVAYQPLDKGSISLLVQRMLQELLGRRGLRQRQALVQVDPDLVELMVDQGYDVRYGARSMKRVLEQQLTVPLARHLVSHAMEDTTLLQLFRRGRHIGVDAQRLTPDRRPRLENLSVEGDWAELQRRVVALDRALRQVLGGDDLAQVEDLQARLLDRFNRGLLSGAEQADAAAVGLLLEEGRDLRIDVEALREELEASYHFEQKWDRWWDRSDRYHETPIVEPREDPVVPNRGHGVLRKNRSRLQALRVRLASLAYRLGARTRPPRRPALLRFLPVTNEEGTRSLAVHLAQDHLDCWKRWGAVMLLLRTNTKWVVLRPGQQPHSGCPELKQLVERSRGAAVWLEGPGVLDVIDDSVGFWQHSYYSGPDRVCELVRVEEVGNEGVAPVDRLMELDWEMGRYLERRRRGEAVPSPQPGLSVRRTFHDFKCTDDETGVDLELPREIDYWGGANIYPNPSMRAELYDVAMMRLFSRLAVERGW